MRRFALWTALALLAPSLSFAGELPDGAFGQLGSAAFRHPDRASALAYRPDGKHLASGGPDGCVRIWDAAKGAELLAIKQKDGHANTVVYSADGTRLVVHFSDEKIRLYDVANNYKALRTVAVKNLDSLSVTADAKFIAAVTTGGQLAVVETATGLDRMEVPEGKAIAISPDGSTVAAANADNIVKVYEVPSGKPLAEFATPKADKSTVSAIAYSADGKRLAVAAEGATNRVRIYDVAKKELALTIDGEAPLAFCGENKLALRQAGKLALYDLGTSKRLHVLGDSLTALAVTPDGQRAATDGAGYATARIRVWNLTEGTEQLAKDDTLVGLRGLVPTGEKGAYWVIGEAGISTWVPSSNPKLLSPQTKPILAFARSKTSFYIADAARVRRVPMTASDAAHTVDFTAFPDGVRHVAVSTDDALIAASTVGEKPQLCLATDYQNLKVAIPLPSPALDIALHPEKKTVAVIGRDGQLRVWDTNATSKTAELWKARVARSLKAHVAYSPDGRLIAVSSVVRVSVFDAKTGETVNHFERQWEDGPYSCLVFSPDSRLLIAGTQGTLGSVVVWELATNSVAKRFLGGRGSIAHLGISPDGKTLNTVGADDNGLLWDLSGWRGQTAPSVKQLKTAWMLLSRPDAEMGIPAVWTLQAGGAAALPQIKAGIADAVVAMKKIDQLVADLGSKEFPERENASKELAGIGAPALPALKLVEEKSTNAEVRERAGKLLVKIAAAGEKLPDTGLVGEPLRLLRAVAVLESIPGEAAKEQLEEIRTVGGLAGAAAERSLKFRK